jgi:hypothetical protein
VSELFVHEPTVVARPSEHRVGSPDLAHLQHPHGRREVIAVDELLDALAADTEQLTDLGGADQMMHVSDHSQVHSQDATCHLTSGQEMRETSQVTRATQMTLGARHKASGVGPCQHLVLYGLSCEDYEELRARARGHCEICGIAEGDTPRGYLVVDHFHGDDRPGVAFIRGMICDKCNAGVMACLDGLKVWGANRKWEAAARAYEANSWHRPSDEARRQMAARTEKLPRAAAPRRRWPVARRDTYGVPEQIDLPLHQGQLVIAKKLRRYLTAKQLARLVELLTEEG